MCGIAGALSLSCAPMPNLKQHLQVMNFLQAHRGPDGEGVWIHQKGQVGFAHRRLSIIDLTTAAAQPMESEAGLVITYNGEIYNYLELREELGHDNINYLDDILNKIKI